MTRSSDVEVRFEGPDRERDVQRGDIFIAKNTDCSISKGDVAWKLCQVKMGKVKLIELGEGNRTSLSNSKEPVPIDDVTVEKVAEALEYSNPDDVVHVPGDQAEITVEVKH